MKFFSVESPFYKFISRLWDVIALSFFWTICSLPIVTIGPATVAAFTITLRMVDNVEGYIVKPFFKEFRNNLKQGIPLGLIAVACIAAIRVDFMFSDKAGFLVLAIFSIVFVICALIYAFPLTARYENKLSKNIRNSFRISMRYFGRTLLMCVAVAAELLVFFWNEITLLIGAFTAPAVIMLTISGFAMKIFREIEQDGGAIIKKTEEDLYNEEIERETQEVLKREHID